MKPRHQSITAGAYHIRAWACFGTLATCATVACPGNDIVTEWNVAIIDHIQSRYGTDTPDIVEARILALAHESMLHAVRAALEASDHHPTKPGACPEAAGAQAIRDVLAVVCPDGLDGFDQILSRQMEAVPSSRERDRGVETGAQVARQILSERVWEPWVAVTGSGGALTSSAIRTAKPFAVDRLERFRVRDPTRETLPSDVSRFVRNKGLATLMRREHAAAWADWARFWSESPTRCFNRLARELSANTPRSLLDQTLLFATLNAAIADACMAAEELRRHFAVPRVQYELDDARYVISGYDEAPTVVAREWPAVPGYPSVRASACGASAAVLESIFRQDWREITIKQTPHEKHSPEMVGARQFAGISEAARECAIAGFLVGNEFKEACMQGYGLGERIGLSAVRQTHRHRGR